MFEAAEVGNKLEKKAYSKEAPKVREAVLQAQKKLASANLSVAILISGVEGAGKGETVDLLLSWLDARGIETHAFAEPTDEELHRPPMWRYWRDLPPKGRIGIFLGSWYTPPIIDRVFGRIGDARFDRSLERISSFERMLTREGILLIKIWMHLSKPQQQKRLKKLSRDRDQSWRVTKQDWKFFKRYDEFRAVSERALSRTGTDGSAWHIIEGADPRWRTLAVTKTILSSLDSRLEDLKNAHPSPRKPDLPAPDEHNLLRSLDLKVHLGESKYEKQLVRRTAKIARLARKLREKQRSMIVLFEGPDAGGKGGAIRRLTSAMDARNYRVISVAAPTEEERSHPYLWRFWRHLPRLGRVTIYDRSWYGRVLVERLEGFCARADWQRAYGEINAFEEELSEFGIILLKFWMAISPDEQLRRFHERELTPYKQYKLTEEDWRNRKKSRGYEAAACEMIEKTSTPHSPWTLVEANDKNWARIRVLSTVSERLEREL